MPPRLSSGLPTIGCETSVQATKLALDGRSGKTRIGTPPDGQVRRRRRAPRPPRRPRGRRVPGPAPPCPTRSGQFPSLVWGIAHGRLDSEQAAARPRPTMKGETVEGMSLGVEDAVRVRVGRRTSRLRRGRTRLLAVGDLAALTVAYVADVRGRGSHRAASARVGGTVVPRRPRGDGAVRLARGLHGLPPLRQRQPADLRLELRRGARPLPRDARRVARLPAPLAGSRRTSSTGGCTRRSRRRSS